MFLIAGISPKIRQLGRCESAVCPVCGQNSILNIIHKYMTPHIFFIPTFRFHSTYMATCGRCASAMELDPKKGAAFSKDASTPIHTGDLTILQDNRTVLCPSCRCTVRPQDRFCPQCGSVLGG